MISLTSAKMMEILYIGCYVQSYRRYNPMSRHTHTIPFRDGHDAIHMTCDISREV